MVMENKIKEQLTSELIRLENEKEKINNLLAPINKEIDNIRKQLDNIKKEKLFPDICKKIDELFSLPENQDCNIVVLNTVHGESSGRSLYEHNYNEFWFNTYVDEYNQWATTIDYSEKNMEMLDRIYELAINYVPSSEEEYGDDSGVNCYWYGVVALHKNHTIVGFVCREDNYMLNNYKTAPDILFDFNR